MSTGQHPDPPQPASRGDAAPRRGQFVATVHANIPLCREHNRLVLRVSGMPPSSAGQFLQVRCRPYDEAPLGDFPDAEHQWRPGDPFPTRQPDMYGPTPVIRRPFSIAGRRDLEGDLAEIDLINRDIGPGTHFLAHAKPGDLIDVIGPLGNTFTLPGRGGAALLVGGGVGIPPMIYLAQAIAEHNSRLGPRGGAVRSVAFCGVMSGDLLPLTFTPGATPTPSGDEALSPQLNTQEFDCFRVPVVIATDDGSLGFRGRVTAALESFLDRQAEALAEAGGGPPTVYTCGPEPMMKAVARICVERGLHCQVAVERAMACGLGTCQSCVIRQRSDHQRGWVYRLACTDGPVFDGAELLW